MCGIFGFAIGREAKLSARKLDDYLERLFLLSESRGKESAGLHVCLPTKGAAWTLKGDLPASEFVETSEYKAVLQEMHKLAYGQKESSPQECIVIMGHSRLVTNGAADFLSNNQPVRTGSVTVVHNGIVVNADDLWEKHGNLQRHAQVDTEIIAALLNEEVINGKSAEVATAKVFKELRGSASIAWSQSGEPTLTLATNTGDLHYIFDQDQSLAIYASELFILRQIADIGSLSRVELRWLQPGHCTVINAYQNTCDCLELKSCSDDLPSKRHSCSSTNQKDLFVSAKTRRCDQVITRQVDFRLLRYNEASIRSLRRCTKCVLPETFPFISFDEGGVCSYCANYTPKYSLLNTQKARTDLMSTLELYRSGDGRADVLVPFSGGRDSCYGLHLLKKEFGLNPITFTYDWGMVTDLARRNIARMCGQLGVQNILVSADIAKKRMNIRRNVTAWLRRPSLGVVPLFMAGDKHFFKVVNVLKKQTGIRLNIWSSNELENTDFKSGFCGIKPDFQKERFDYLNWHRKCQLVGYYAWQFARNPAYINTSLPDTVEAFYSYYIEERKDYLWLFNHIKWDEQEVDDVICKIYDFERAFDSTSTWRIGDGTAPFYNYIYVTARGFSEFDTFRSNQVREGMLSRDAALDLVVNDNRPRHEGLKWYIDAIGLDFNSIVSKLNELDLIGIHR